MPRARPVHDPRAFLSRLRRRIAAASLVTFGAFFGLATFNVVGVTAHGATSPGTTAIATPTLALPPGDFFGQPGSPVLAGPVAQPQVILGGGPPILSSGSS